MASWTDLLASSRTFGRRRTGGRRGPAGPDLALGGAAGRKQGAQARGRPAAAPGWATHSISEEDGIVHETISPLCPLVVHRQLNGQDLIPTEVSLSTTDVQVDGRWIRTGPTVQVEGGSYTLDSARQLRAALDDLLARTDRTPRP